MKILQGMSEESWTFTSYAELRGVARRLKDPRQVILLLHGLGERGKRIFRKLLPYLPQDALVLAPNAPFPIPRDKEGQMDFGHTWYFYDKFQGKYFINQDLAKYWLRDLVHIENPLALPLTIIGFSQGGYLAPLVGLEIKETKRVVGLSCEFRSSLIPEGLPFSLAAFHGDKDEIISAEMALNEIEKLKEKEILVDFYLVNNTGHEISSDMAKKVQSILESYGK